MKNNRSVLIYLFFCLLLVGSTGCSKKMSSIYLTTSESLNRGYDTSRELVAIDPVLYKSRFTILQKKNDDFYLSRIIIKNSQTEDNISSERDFDTKIEVDESYQKMNLLGITENNDTTPAEDFCYIVFGNLLRNDGTIDSIFLKYRFTDGAYVSKKIINGIEVANAKYPEMVVNYLTVLGKKNNHPYYGVYDEDYSIIEEYTSTDNNQYFTDVYYTADMIDGNDSPRCAIKMGTVSDIFNIPKYTSTKVLVYAWKQGVIETVDYITPSSRYNLSVSWYVRLGVPYLLSLDKDTAKYTVLPSMFYAGYGADVNTGGYTGSQPVSFTKTIHRDTYKYPLIRNEQTGVTEPRRSTDDALYLRKSTNEYSIRSSTSLFDYYVCGYDEDTKTAHFELIELYQHQGATPQSYQTASIKMDKDEFDGPVFTCNSWNVITSKGIYTRSLYKAQSQYIY